MVPGRFLVVPGGREPTGNEWFPVTPIGGNREPFVTVGSCRRHDRDFRRGGGNRSGARGG